MEAMDAAKNGQDIIRDGWDGANMFVRFTPVDSYPEGMGLEKEYFGGVLNPHLAHWLLKDTQEAIGPWVPSGPDMLANDWYTITLT
ncbi:MAG: MW1434 family type I TA system toxin [Candidatus Roizmanbacteria bacterium]